MTDIDNQIQEIVPETLVINNDNGTHTDTDNNFIKHVLNASETKSGNIIVEEIQSLKEIDQLVVSENKEVENTLESHIKDCNENDEHVTVEISQQNCEVKEAGDELIDISSNNHNNCTIGDTIISHGDHDPNPEEHNKISDFIDDKTNLNIDSENTNENVDTSNVLADNAQISKNIDSVSIKHTYETTEQNIENNKGSEAENFVDILGNGLLTKKIIVYGLGRETRPTHGDSVTIQYKGWNSSEELIEENESTFVLGDGDMIQAFDLGICLAERHEEFELRTDARFAYGSYGWEPKVQPNEPLVYRIKLLRVDDSPDYTTFTHQDRMDAADVKRERGNYLYRREEYSLAVNSYSRAIKIIQTDPDYKRASTDPSKADMYDLFVKVTNNLAAAQLKLESYDNVIETCNTILNYDASNVKALFRKGKSLTMKGNYDEAIPILKRALELENSKLIAGEIQRCYQLKRADDEQRARVCRKMFGTGGKNSPEKDEESATYSWKKTVYKYSPYIGAVIITGISVMLASIAIAKSKGN